MVILNIEGMTVDASSKCAYKIGYLRNFLRSYKGNIPIITITESWLKGYVSDAQVNIPSYTVHRSDRSLRRRGGCITYIHESIPVGETLRFDNKFCEVVVTPLEKVTTAVVNIYRPPNTPLYKFTEAINFIQNFIYSVNDSWTFLISGDLNFPNIDWTSLSITTGLTTNENSSARSLLDFLERNGMGQFIDIPTRVSSAENTLEVLITNSSELVLDVKSEKTMLSDHDWITVSLGSDFSSAKPSESSVNRPFGFSWFDFNKADFGRVSSYIENTNWTDMILEDPENFPRHFEETLLNICHLCVPIKKSFTDASQQARKFKSPIAGLKRKQKVLRCRFKAIQAINPQSPRLSVLKTKLENVDASIKSKLSLTRHREEMEAVTAIKSNPRFFYSYAKKFSKLKCKIGPLKVGSSNFVSEPKQMANLLQKQFCSVFSDPQSQSKEDPKFIQAATFLEDITLTIEDFVSAIDNMRLHSAPGEDEIPAILFKSCKDSISVPLFLLWRYSFENGSINPRPGICLSSSLQFSRGVVN